MADKIVLGLRMGAKLWEASADEMPRMTGHSRWLMNAAADEIGRPRAALEQVAIVCTDNMGPTCDHRMALDFVRQVANRAFEQSAP